MNKILLGIAMHYHSDARDVAVQGSTQLVSMKVSILTANARMIPKEIQGCCITKKVGYHRKLSPTKVAFEVTIGPLPKSASLRLQSGLTASTRRVQKSS